MAHQSPHDTLCFHSLRQGNLLPPSFKSWKPIIPQPLGISSPKPATAAMDGRTTRPHSSDTLCLCSLQKPFFLSRAMLTGLADATWTGEHDTVLEHFVQDPTVPALTIFIDPIVGLKLELGMPVQVGTRSPGSPPWS